MVLLVGCEARGVEQIDDGLLFQERHVFYWFSQRDHGFSQPLPARRHRPGKLRSRCKRGPRLSCRGVIPGLENFTEALGITLRPTTSNRRIVVDENIWTIRNRLALE